MMVMNVGFDKGGFLMENLIDDFIYTGKEKKLCLLSIHKKIKLSNFP